MGGRTALHFAAKNDRADVARLLLDYGASPSAISDGGWTPLHNAAQNGHIAIVRLLLEHSSTGDTKDGVKPNSQLRNGMTPLHWEAFKGSMDVVQGFLAVEPAINIVVKDSFGRTPMLCAAEKGHIDLAEILSDEARKASSSFEAIVVDFIPSVNRQKVFKTFSIRALVCLG